jgi:hypothetical protein
VFGIGCLLAVDEEALGSCTNKNQSLSLSRSLSQISYDMPKLLHYHSFPKSKPPIYTQNYKPHVEHYEMQEVPPKFKPSRAEP